jgi:hypothetical protein
MNRMLTSSPAGSPVHNVILRVFPEPLPKASG